MANEYEPFGEEWKKEMMKWKKELLIEFIRVRLIELDELKKSTQTYLTNSKPKA